MHTTKEFSSISELKHIREQKSRLSEREAELVSPILTNLEFIPYIYELFKNIVRTINIPPREKIIQRKEFLFIILFLFVPSVLAGGRIPNGVRKSLEHVFPKVKPCTISNNIADVFFLYQQYKYFRSDINIIYKEMLKRLEEGDTLDELKRLTFK
ncbi:MAG: hypothetical protein ACLUVZ_08865 [Bacteroides stercoris]